MNVGLVLALLLAQASPVPDVDGPIFTNPATMTTAAISYATFEFAPASGVGMTDACPTPNWVSYSQAINSWAALNSVCTAITTTANYGVAPDGTTTAERLQIPACTAATSYNLLRNNFSVLAGMTCAVWAKAVSGTPTFYLSGGATGSSPRAACSPTTSAWTQCTLDFSTTDSSFDFGNNTYLGVGIASAADVLVWGAWCGFGTPPTSPLLTTATAPLGVNPTGVAGETLTLARASTAMCTKTSTGGLATTGIANGDLVLIPAAYARVEYDSDGVKGLLVEGSSTNYATRSQEFNNAVWSPFGSGAAAPTVTANAGTAPDGTLTADRLQVAATTTTGRSVVFQGALVAPSVSVYVKGYGGTSGVIDATGDTGGVTTGCGCAYNGTTWTRCVVNGTATGSFTIGNDGVAGGCGSGTRAALDVLVWGAQRETYTRTTSYIPTTSSAVTRAVESASFAVTWPATAAAASVAATVSGYAGRANAWWASLEVAGNNYLAGYTDGASLLAQATLGAAVARTASGSALASIAATTRVAAYQTDTTITLVQNGVSTSTTAGGISTWTPTRVAVGSSYNFAAYPNDAITSRVCTDPSSTRCR